MNHHPRSAVLSGHGNRGPCRLVQPTAGRLWNDGDTQGIRPRCDSVVARNDGNPGSCFARLGDDMACDGLADLTPLASIEQRAQPAFGHPERLDGDRNQDVGRAHP